MTDGAEPPRDLFEGPSVALFFQFLAFGIKAVILSAVLKPQDIVVLLKLVGSDRNWKFEDVARDLEMSLSAVHRSVSRASQAGLFNSRRRVVNTDQLHEFLVHGARYLLPPEMHGPARGMPTAWATAPLAGHLVASGQEDPVWPYPKGRKKGIALEPIHPSVPRAAQRDPELYEVLALFDAIRIGGPRERNIAAKELKARFRRQPVKA